MGYEDNKVLSTALSLSRNIMKIIPERVILGYSKLLTLDESVVANLVPSELMGDLENARKWFAEKNIDMVLVKTGMMLLVGLIPSSKERTDDEDKFSEYLSNTGGNTASVEILNKAMETANTYIMEVFRNGCTMDTVFESQRVLKKDYEESKKNEPETDQTDKSSGKTEFVKETGAGLSGRDPSADSRPSFVKQTESRETEPSESNTSKPQDFETLSNKYRELSTALLDTVKGQDKAIFKFIQGYNQGELLRSTQKGDRPRSYFFFFGPPGVGKTLLADTAAEVLGIAHKTFNMSEYSGHQAHEDLIGISKQYNGAMEGTLVKFVRENPESILIFDEIEKAHIHVIRLFLQILGSGVLKNVYRNEDVSFKNTVIIFTSNVGRELYEDRTVNLSTLPERVLIDVIRKEKNAYGEPALPLEICSRIGAGNTVIFNHLSVRHLDEMVNSSFDEVVAGMEQEYEIRITYSKYLPLLFLFNRGGDIDARIATSQSGKFLKDELFELLRQLENNKNLSKVRSIDLDVDWDGMDKELTRLFKKDDESEVMIFASDKDFNYEEAGTEHYKIHVEEELDSAREYVKRDLAAVCIDPFYGKDSDDGSILSITDYNTDGVKLFHSLVETQSNMPIFLLERDKKFSETDRRTFLQEGATGIISIDSNLPENYRRMFSQIMDELYMENESKSFTQRGWIVDYKTRQTFNGDDRVSIEFYDLKKKMAVDLDSRGSILADAERPNVRFEDVIGAEKAKEELQYFVKYLKNPKQFLLSGGVPPKGVLLYGPPGTGKTMLAKAMAGECDVVFLEKSAAELKNKYVGESEGNIKKLFQRARKYAPAIIFIDEIDAIGKQRTGSDSGSVTESMLNILLTEMDGFSSGDSNKPVFVLAATNYGAGEETDGIQKLDSALIRRFDNKIYVDLPKESERKEFLMRMLKKKGVETVSEDTAQSIAERTTGQSLAILQNVLELAIRNATKESRPVEDNDLLTALEEYIYGEKKEHSPEYYKSVAIHETGHAYVSYISGDKPSYITIESRGNFGGYMQHANSEDITDYTKEDLLARIRSSLAGRAAETVFYGPQKSLNTGASSDLQNATDIAFRILCRYGMDDSLVVLGRDEILKSNMASEYIGRVNDILKTQMEETIKIIEGAKDVIQAIADVLVKENRLTGDQFDELMKRYNKEG